jgi:hypothetical protein
MTKENLLTSDSFKKNLLVNKFKNLIAECESIVFSMPYPLFTCHFFSTRYFFAYYN